MFAQKLRKQKVHTHTKKKKKKKFSKKKKAWKEWSCVEVIDWLKTFLDDEELQQAKEMKLRGSGLEMLTKEDLHHLKVGTRYEVLNQIKGILSKLSNLFDPSKKKKKKKKPSDKTPQKAMVSVLLSTH